ncbi:hypothetical protein A2533_01945 [Candidatus Falkowbacteria bacterium RIFOXYD2_FULL_35_9]|uniref:SprT-like domain-containing protein n=1 Tax=Candidatus Falkowbacteria bacterium RIFOXYC2_FULL_36_12 TaxID=1798002 RepID=A0A1F5SY40_9BACT|nr:MAG: hypothetical protein A2300_04285 [Candidatus Falkowbacteria bacterium RIFOXYB2_FULL_35_7]OGF31610.1 MAG: hypothetical protein A2478_03935 [Candidatus Falkowbacteria bacterium RIFOXYC2_FULL_36_12]OGF46878.1 MAG: hypothetical protein A2533_01945 [Candidatus Falkowbacteria bacterium RIFOXYD2_FULL_35_9]
MNEKLYSNERYPEFVQMIYDYVIHKLFKYPDYKFRIIKRKKEVNPNHMVLGYINFQKQIIALDIYTPKKRQAKSINSLLRTIAHEIAHIQKPPYRQRYRGRYITRQHYPVFYKQCDKNIEKIKKDPYLKQYFRQTE